MPPAPSTTARPPPVTPAPRSAATIPATSVLSANRRPPVSTRVLAAPVAAASGDTSDATSSATRLSGMVSERPAHSGPSPATNPGSPASSHSCLP